MEDEESDACNSSINYIDNVLKKFGFIGLILYSKLKNSEIKKILRYDNFILKMIECYFDKINIVNYY